MNRVNFYFTGNNEYTVLFVFMVFHKQVFFLKFNSISDSFSPELKT